MDDPALVLRDARAQRARFVAHGLARAVAALRDGRKMMDSEEMRRHAADWVAAWNRRDIEAVLRGFAPSARFVSPKAIVFAGTATLEGRPAIGEYWRRALARIGTLEFRLGHVTCDPARGEMVVFYEARLDDAVMRACELMRFDGAGRQVFGEALYGAPL